MLLATTLALVYAKYQESQLKADTPQCNVLTADYEEGEFTADIALKDYNKPEDEQLGLMYCFCEETFFTALSAG